MVTIVSSVFADGIQPVIDALTKNGANYLDQLVVVSGKIITGNGPGASEAFAKALVSALAG